MSDLPLALRRFAAQVVRVAADRWMGRQRRWVLPSSTGPSIGATFPIQLSLTQRVLATEYVEAKRHNLALAGAALGNLPIAPGQMLSFWRLVGRPTATRGFRAGRSLLGGELRPDFGGGLCQLSGLLHHLALLAGLEIHERHAHSRDIYDDATRFTPLGADATVAYGLKDLRIANSQASPVCFRFVLADQALTGHLCSTAGIVPCELEFRTVAKSEAETIVQTWRRERPEAPWRQIAVSRYQRMRSTAAHSPAVGP